MAEPIEERTLHLQLTEIDARLHVRAEVAGRVARAEGALPGAALADEIAALPPGQVAAARLQQVGRQLYDHLMQGEVGALARELLARPTDPASPPHLVLRFDHDQVALASYPWELLCDPTGRFLVRDARVDLSRTITYPQPPPDFDPDLRARALLRVVSLPDTLDELSVGELALEALELERLEEASFESVQRRLLLEPRNRWGFEFAGHGMLVSRCADCGTLNPSPRLSCEQCGSALESGQRVGALAFERWEPERNRHVAEWVAVDSVGALLFNARIDVALLLACETARVGDATLFSGLAPGLLLAGVPAALGMQFSVRDTFADRFTRHFYESLAATGDLAAALRLARQMNRDGAWYSPVLYRRHRPRATTGPLEPVYAARKVDTAVPAEVRGGTDFLARLWIRRPESAPASEAELRATLDVADDVGVLQQEGESEIEFRPVKGRRFRRGQVEARLQSPQCEILNERISLFVDEHLDAPPAIFALRAPARGRATLLFSLWQDGGQILSAVHHVRLVEETPDPRLVTGSHEIGVIPQFEIIDGGVIRVDIEPEGSEILVPDERVVLPPDIIEPIEPPEPLQPIEPPRAAAPPAPPIQPAPEAVEAPVESEEEMAPEPDVPRMPAPAPPPPAPLPEPRATPPWGIILGAIGLLAAAGAAVLVASALGLGMVQIVIPLLVAVAVLAAIAAGARR